jgi:hypothetical protein
MHLAGYLLYSFFYHKDRSRTFPRNVSELQTRLHGVTSQKKVVVTIMSITMQRNMRSFEVFLILFYDATSLRGSLLNNAIPSLSVVMISLVSTRPFRAEQLTVPKFVRNTLYVRGKARKRTAEKANERDRHTDKSTK